MRRHLSTHLVLALLTAGCAAKRGGAGRRNNKRQRSPRCPITGCQRCNNQTSCQVCRPGYALTEDERCGSCGAYCSTCTSAGPENCDKCIRGYTLHSPTEAPGTCEKCAQHCNSCDASGPNKCDACGPRRMLDVRMEVHDEVHECVPCGSGCRKCSAEVGCKTCAHSPSPSPGHSPNPSPGPSPSTSPGPGHSPSTSPSPGHSPGTSPGTSPGHSPNPNPNPRPCPDPSPDPSPLALALALALPFGPPSPNPSPEPTPRCDWFYLLHANGTCYFASFRIAGGLLVMVLLCWGVCLLLPPDYDEEPHRRTVHGTAHAVYMQSACSTHAVYMQSACSVHAMYMQSTCSVHAMYMQSTCSVHALGRRRSAALLKPPLLTCSRPCGHPPLQKPARWLRVATWV